MRALEGQPTSAIVRVPHSDDWILKQVLDLGAQSVLVPMVETAEQASDIVAACKYAPQGRRGVGYALARASRYNAISDYAATANEEVCVIVQVETLTAMKNIPKIAKVKGIDCIFIGPADLSLSYTHKPSFDIIDPPVNDVIELILSKAKKHNVVAGIHTGSTEYAHKMIHLGFQFVTILSEAKILSVAAEDILKNMKKDQSNKNNKIQTTY